MSHLKAGFVLVQLEDRLCLLLEISQASPAPATETRQQLVVQRNLTGHVVAVVAVAVVAVRHRFDTKN